MGEDRIDRDPYLFNVHDLTISSWRSRTGNDLSASGVDDSRRSLPAGLISTWMPWSRTSAS
jgi:hypothetical protein